MASFLCADDTVAATWVAQDGGVALAELLEVCCVDGPGKDVAAAAQSASALWVLCSRLEGCEPALYHATDRAGLALMADPLCCPRAGVKNEIGLRPGVARSLVWLCKRGIEDVHAVSQACGCIAELCLGEAHQRDGTKEVRVCPIRGGDVL